MNVHQIGHVSTESAAILAIADLTPTALLKTTNPYAPANPSLKAIPNWNVDRLDVATTTIVPLNTLASTDNVFLYVWKTTNRAEITPLATETITELFANVCQAESVIRGLLAA